ncbi:MAG: tetratricopeptide repeat protein, partial [Chloroflexi bacterium]|nr:tetratricopeptide repeat protein [Chloroflexota bacterium]
MSQDQLEDTQHIKNSGANPSPAQMSDTQPVQVKKPRRGRVILLGILITLLLGAAGAGIGYTQGIQDRINHQREELIKEAATQFQYGMLQFDKGNYELARTHFEYVLQNYPEFPGITEKYTETMVRLAQSSAPVVQAQATPTLTNMNAEALFNQAVQEVQTQQWAAAINTLDALRSEDTSYRTLEVDGMYFITLRFRAVEMIVTEGNLEEGLYFMSLLSKYAPLDHDAVNYSTWARLYLTGASYWEVDWEQVINFFSQLAAAFPYMHDGNGWTANDRLIRASEYYGDQLASSG